MFEIAQILSEGGQHETEVDVKYSPCRLLFVVATAVLASVCSYMNQDGHTAKMCPVLR